VVEADGVGWQRALQTCWGGCHGQGGHRAGVGAAAGGQNAITLSHIRACAEFVSITIRLRPVVSGLCFAMARFLKSLF
jgi:hypothetical protein